MEICEALSFYHSRVKYVTLQELLANSTQSLIRDSKKIAKKSRVIKNECQFELNCTVYYKTYKLTHRKRIHDLAFSSSTHESHDS